MSQEILINVTPRETRVAVVENGVLQEIYIERTASRGLVGNIHRGRVCRVLPGMEAAFVDIGLERAAFLHVSDIGRNADDVIAFTSTPLGDAAQGKVVAFRGTAGEHDLSRRDPDQRRLNRLISSVEDKDLGGFGGSVLELEPELDEDAHVPVIAPSTSTSCGPPTPAGATGCLVPRRGGACGRRISRTATSWSSARRPWGCRRNCSTRPWSCVACSESSEEADSICWADEPVSSAAWVTAPIFSETAAVPVAASWVLREIS